MFKAEIQEENGLWHDVLGPDGRPLTFVTSKDAHARLEELYPILCKLEKYGGDKRTRVVAILEDEDEDDNV